ncbi:MAG: serine--tRNA ligase [Longimicrobiales bacterium]|nr:serine--tRNA ligase [Longimicrobiales bacterium]
MLDIRRLRAEPDAAKKALARRDPSLPEVVDRILELDETRRDAIGEVNELKAERNTASRRVGELKRAGEDAEALIAETRALGGRIDELDEIVRSAEGKIRAHLLEVPNIPLDAVPEGDESENEILARWGEPKRFDFEARPHWDLGAELGVLDLPRGAKVAGSGFPLLRGPGARLQRGLINFFLDVHVSEHGYEELRVPYLVNPDAMVGTGQLPKFADESYQTEQDGLWLLPTAEVPVTNLHRDELLDMDEMPVRYTAYSPCFRREAGAAGKDTRGLLRVHQFDKVELVRYELPERSLEALDELTREAETLLERMGLTYRRVILATGDLGQSAATTYDLEVWAPGVRRWLEVSSCTTFTDYQARRANIRFRRSQAEKPEFVHTLNGSALALPRVVAALLETYQTKDGSVSLPEVLHPYVGSERLEPSG